MPRGGAGAVECDKVRYQIFEVRLSACTGYYKADTTVELSVTKPIFPHRELRVTLCPNAYLLASRARTTPRAHSAPLRQTTHHAALTRWQEQKKRPWQMRVAELSMRSLARWTGDLEAGMFRAQCSASGMR